MEKGFLISSSPHIRSGASTQGIMKDVLIALIPALTAGIYFFRLKALLVVLVTVAASIGAEYISNILMKKRQTVGDYSAAVTGLLLAFNLPPSIPLWIAVTGGVFAIIIVKQLFGGLGQNFMNPALAARAFLLASWPVQMTLWTSPVDGVTTATPLALIKKGGEAVAGVLPSYMSLFSGNVAGSIGETSAIALALGAAYLLFRRVIIPLIPLGFIATVALMTWTLGGESLFSGDVLYHILSGGLMLGAFFMATDYATTPSTVKGMLIFGIGCGLLTSIIRLYGGYPEGVSYSILLMNVAAPLIERYTRPKVFGGDIAHA
ncbi:MAG: RnfABCDGE type electron transport complex subunit D [Ruminiclostridium sp.]|nr:RnfABCDGE type electron transport complex subunit D [Ruminiclostridium sp.]